MKNRVIRNTVSMFTGQSAAHALALLFNFYLGKSLSDGAYGRLQFAIAFVVIFMVLGEYGLQTMLVRDIARDKSQTDNLFWNSIILKTFLTLVAGVIGYSVLHNFYADFPEKQFLVYLVSGSMLFNAWYFSVAAVFIGHQENHLETLFFFIGKLIYVTLGTLAVFYAIKSLWMPLIYKQFSLNISTLFYIQNEHCAVTVSKMFASFISKPVRFVAAIFSIAAAAQFCIALIFLLKRHRINKFTFSISTILLLLKKGWMFFSITLFTTLHLKFDYIFISKWCQDADLGHYAGAYNLVLAPILLANAFVRSMYPALAELHAKQDEHFWQRVFLGFRWLAVLAFIVLFYMTIDGSRVLAFAYKKSFVAGLLPMQILLWGQGLDFFCPFAGHILYVLDQQKKVIIITGLSVLANLIADYFLIYRYGTVGASWAMVISLSVMFWGYAIALRKWLPILRLLSALLLPLLAAALCAPLAYYGREFLPFWLNAIVYIAVSLTVIMLCRFIKISDLKLFSVGNK